jgi:DNA recombination protein RmuC
MLPWWAAILIAALAGLLAWLWAVNSERSRNAKRLVELEARLKTLEQSDRQLRSDLQQKDKELGQLQQTREAKASLEAQVQALEKRRSELDSELTGKTEELKTTARELAESREIAASLRSQLAEAQRALQEKDKLLQQATDIFSNLRTPSVKGRWGELTLRNVVEIAGMSEFCDFQEQVARDAETGRLRPDLIVRLPAGRQVVVDAKAPLDAFQEAMQSTSEEDRRAAMVRHAGLVRGHMRNLSSKAYWNQFPQAPEFVVMFLPGESFFSGALEADGKLLEDGMKERVVLATPTTLIALLWAVANGWRWEKIAQNADEIRALGADLYQRMTNLTGPLADIGSALKRAVESYNRAVGSMESRFLPAIRRFKELGATAADDIPTLEPIEQAPRSLPEE